MLFRSDDKTDTPMVAKAVTLEVNMEDAQKLVLAANVGNISLTLRQAGAGEGDATRRVTTSDLGVSMPVVAKLQKKETPKADPFSIIGVYRAAKRSEYPVPPPR